MAPMDLDGHFADADIAAICLPRRQNQLPSRWSASHGPVATSSEHLPCRGSTPLTSGALAFLPTDYEMMFS